MSINPLRVFGALTGAALLSGTPVHAAALLKVSGGNKFAVPGNNDFRGPLHSVLGLDFYSNNRTITLTRAAKITVYYLVAESGFTNRFTSGPVAWNEDNRTSFTPVLKGSYIAPKGAYLPFFNTPTGGVTSGPSAPGSTGFGIFLPSNSTRGFTASSLVFGYDDPTSRNVDHLDKDYDDFMVQIIATPTPEPEAWASLGVGMGLAAFVARRRRKSAAA